MTDILLLSVGQSPEPLIQSITRIRPDRVVFLCSQDTKSQIETITSRVRIPSFQPERDVEVLRQVAGASNEIDQLHVVYGRCRALLKRLRLEAPGGRIAVDYTGGTKTMATGLGLAAIDDGRVDLFLTTTERRQTGASSIAGNSRPIPVESGAIQFQRLLADGLTPLLERHDYAAAQAAVSAVLRLPQAEGTSSTLRRLDDLMLALDAWDRWDLERAESLLKEHASDRGIRDRFLFSLQRVLRSRDLMLMPQKGDSKEVREAVEKRRKQAEAALSKGTIHGLEAVEDLLLNAERRAHQERYDDAVGRLYRSMELTAQLLLLIDHGGIRTGNLDVELLPAKLRAAYEARRDQEKGTIHLALQNAFDLLAELAHPAGKIWEESRSRFVNALSVRNFSLLAHGFDPVGYAEWQELNRLFSGFIQSLLEQRRGKLPALVQLPRGLQELEAVAAQASPSKAG